MSLAPVVRPPCQAMTAELLGAVDEAKRYFTPEFDATVVRHEMVPSEFMPAAIAVLATALAAST